MIKFNISLLSNGKIQLFFLNVILTTSVADLALNFFNLQTKMSFKVALLLSTGIFFRVPKSDIEPLKFRHVRQASAVRDVLLVEPMPYRVTSTVIQIGEACKVKK